MAIRIPLDSSGNPDKLHLILATRSGRFISALPATNIKFSDEMVNGSEISFTIDKVLCVDADGNANEELWDSIVGFRLVYCPEIDLWYQIQVSIVETHSTVKNVVAKSLGEAELSKILIHNVEINTESDIERDDYVPTVLYNETNPDASLIDRLLYKAPHYRIGHVDDTLKNLQRTFTFDGRSVLDAFSEVADELDCLFVLSAKLLPDKKIDRVVNVYDLENYCNDCGARGEFYGTCDVCGGTNITNGYGKDTSIFVSVENLAEQVEYSTNDDEVMNCFRLEAGDDLMTATVVNCNPNGSQYIWYLSDFMLDDMSDELKERILEYNTLYDYYQSEYSYTPDSELRQAFNEIVSKYSVYKDDLVDIPELIVGYPALMNLYYDTVDMQSYLDSVLMPSVEISSTTAVDECAKLTAQNLSPVAVADLPSCSASTASSAVLSVAKCIVDSRYQVKVKESSYDAETNTWTGNFDVVNYSNEDDASTSTLIEIEINDDVEDYIRQKIEKMLSKKSEDITDITSLFSLDDDQFADELEKYCLQRLIAFRDSCQGVLDILIQQGVADEASWASSENDPYTNLYEPYLAKMAAIEAEIKVREDEIAAIVGVYNEDGDLISDGIQSEIISEKNAIQKELDFESFLGEELWLEFAAYRRDDTYSNSNFISDGLNNAELFEYAQEFLDKANKEIYKSAMLQHTIKANMYNLLVMPEFAPLVDNFELGNWIRVRSDGKIFRLRLSKYNIDYDSWSLDVEFTDVREGYDSVSDIQEILSSAKSMTTSYGAVARQASAGQKLKVTMDGWASDGFSLTTNIVGGADNQEFKWNENGFVGREYIPETGEYSLNQIKILNTGVYVTDDGWVTAKAGIGKFNYFDPISQTSKTGFGVIADTLVGSVMLSSQVGVFNSSGSVQITEDGFTMNARASGNTAIFTINREDTQGNKTPIIYLNAEGKLVLSGDAVVTHMSADAIDTGTLSVDRIEANSINIDKLSGSVTLDDWEIDLENQTITLGSLSCDKLTGTLSIDRFGDGIITKTKLATAVQTSLGYADDAHSILTGAANAQNILATSATIETLSSTSANINSLTCSNLTATSFTFDGHSISAKTASVIASDNTTLVINYLGYDS